MVNFILFGLIIAFSIYYHILASRQMKNGGFGDHLKVEPQILVIALINLVSIAIVLVTNILAWSNLLVWLPLLLFSVVWFLFMLTSLTRKITQKDDTVSMIAIDLVILASIVGIAVLVVTGKA